MLLLAVAFLILSVLIGAAAYLPGPVAAAAAVAIALWLAVFAVRERRRHGTPEGVTSCD